MKFRLGFAFSILLFTACTNTETDSTQGKLDRDTTERKSRSTFSQEEGYNVQPEKTVMVPTLGSDIQPGKNMLYSGTLQLSWDKLKDWVGGPVVLDGSNTSIIDQLNAGKMSGSLSEKYSIAVAGSREKVEPVIRKEFKEKFDVDDPDLPNAGSFWIYGYAKKDLPFSYRFKPDTMKFGETAVRSFLQYGSVHDPASDQFEILYYCFADQAPFKQGDCIVRLKPKDGKDEIILAMVDPGKTLQATYEIVSRQADKGNYETTLTVNGRKTEISFPKKLAEDKKFEIPDIALDYGQAWDELVGKKLKKPDMQIDYAFQRVRFKLDETGAKYESESTTSNSAELVSLPDIIFNRPFLIYLREKGEPMPYMALWVENPGIMLKPTK
jgi:hypothetical protein